MKLLFEVTVIGFLTVVFAGRTPYEAGVRYGDFKRDTRSYNILDVSEEILDFFDNPEESINMNSLWNGDSVPPAFVLFTGNDTSSMQRYEFKDAVHILENPNFDKKKRTVIFIHGFTASASTDSTKDVVQAYILHGGYNTIALDWESDARPPYTFHAVPNVKKVGVAAAEALLNMVKAGFNIRTLHIVGHSLGAQMAGEIGRTIKDLSSGAVELRRISGLDPAFPGFYGIIIADHIRNDDAKYVDIIHTDAGILGAPVNTGTVDFWPNGGFNPQPGCFLSSCSHSRSWQFWIDSMKKDSEYRFNAVEADNWEDFKDHDVGEYDPKVVMGYYVPRGLSGNYYLKTNRETPFALGDEGVTYS